jgi:hypothetical protein
MEHEDLQLLRYAALELQANGGDLVRVAGITQRIKDWWAKRKNRKALRELKLPIEQAFRDLDTAINSHDVDAVNRITSRELPALLTQSVRGAEDIRDSMLEHQQDYVGKGGETLAGGNLGWVGRNYQKEKPLVQKLWEMLPEAFRSEIPVGKRIGQPINNFSWYRTYGPEDVYISAAVKDNLWKNLSRMFDIETFNYLAPGYDIFLENLKRSILSDAILVQVNFSPVSSQVERRHANEMRVEVQPPEIAFPAGDSEIFIHIDKVIFTDLGTRATPKHQLSVLGVWPSISNRFRGFKAPVPQPASPTETHLASDGPITRIVKRAVLKKRLPNTQAIVKIVGQTFEHKAQFARILASALRQEIDAECSVRHEDSDIEVQVEVYGTKMAALPAIFGISKYVADEFLNLTKIGVDVEVEPGISELEVIESKVLDRSFRKVAFDCWRTK